MASGECRGMWERVIDPVYRGVSFRARARGGRQRLSWDSASTERRYRERLSRPFRTQSRIGIRIPGLRSHRFAVSASPRAPIDRSFRADFTLETLAFPTAARIKISFSNSRAASDNHLAARAPTCRVDDPTYRGSSFDDPTYGGSSLDDPTYGGSSGC